MSNLINLNAQGAFGSDPIVAADAAAVAGAGSFVDVDEWGAFVWATAGSFAAGTAKKSGRGAVSTAITYPAGYVSFGPFTTIDLTTGSGDAVRNFKQPALSAQV